jgi:hypothetical protein
LRVIALFKSSGSVVQMPGFPVQVPQNERSSPRIPCSGRVGIRVQVASESVFRSARKTHEEDALDAELQIVPPPRYTSADFAVPEAWNLRGKLDVPKERFISYPGLESALDGEPIYGWAGWDHLQRAHALSALFNNRKAEGWGADRLTPILAGLLELLPWLKQWHNEPDADGERMGDMYETVLREDCRELGLTEDDLRAWRPAATRRGRKVKPAEIGDAASQVEKRPRKQATVAADDTTATPPRKAGRKRTSTAPPADSTAAPASDAPAVKPPPARKSRKSTKPPQSDLF